MVEKNISKIRYAFIDVPNTESTTKQILGFSIDWHRLYSYLKTHWQCEKIFFYAGVRLGSEEKNEYQELVKLGYDVRIKPYATYSNPEKIIRTSCPDCLGELNLKIKNGIKWKSNCDVELSVDATELVGSDVEYLIFTGDGDFEYLIRNAVSKNVTVYIISNARKVNNEFNSFSRFSTKLRRLIAEMKERVFFVDIDLWRLKIEKVLPK